MAAPRSVTGPASGWTGCTLMTRATLLSALSGLKKGQQPSLVNEHRVRAADGSYKWALCRGLAVPGAGAPATRIVGSLTDVTERRLLEERLRRQALFDSLTGLPNRVLFMDRLSQAVANAKRHRGYTYAVLWLDLDNFKNLNDSLGHQFGDKLLVQVAERIRGNSGRPTPRPVSAGTNLRCCYLTSLISPLSRG